MVTHYTCNYDGKTVTYTQDAPISGKRLLEAPSAITPAPKTDANPAESKSTQPAPAKPAEETKASAPQAVKAEEKKEEKVVLPVIPVAPVKPVEPTSTATPAAPAKEEPKAAADKKEQTTPVVAYVDHL